MNPDRIIWFISSKFLKQKTPSSLISKVTISFIFNLILSSNQLPLAPVLKCPIFKSNVLFVPGPSKTKSLSFLKANNIGKTVETIRCYAWNYGTQLDARNSKDAASKLIHWIQEMHKNCLYHIPVHATCISFMPGQFLGILNLWRMQIWIPHYRFRLTLEF